MTDFELLLQEHLTPLARFVKFRISNKLDAEDIIQDVCLSATEKFSSLKNISAFKSWLIGIANHKCQDYYRKKANQMHISLDALTDRVLTAGRLGITEHNVVRDTLDLLGEKEKQILYLYYFKDLPQEDIARRLSIPVGTVKSRLHYAKEKFRQNYPTHKPSNGGTDMKKLPEILPQYTIMKSDLSPFSVKWEELQGWLLVPRENEKLTWALYDMPGRKQTEWTEMAVIGKAEVHGIEGVEISAIQHNTEDYYRTGAIDNMERRFVAQLTDTHCRYLAESHVENGVRKVYTFLDGDSFINNWGFGEDNCGNETDLRVKHLLKRDGNIITGHVKKETVDIVGRYNVTIGEQTYDTVCVMDIECFNDNVASEQYLDSNGRTILWRRFNKNDWALDRFGKTWTEMLPNNERLIINGETYVHWYDCVTDYIF